MHALRLARPHSTLTRPSFLPLASRCLRSMSTSFQSGGIAEAIKHDHDELKEYYSNYKKAQTEKEQQQWANQFRWELARHSVGEELLLYPAFEKHFGAEGKRMADQDRAEHKVAKDLLYDLERMNVTDAEYSSKFQKLMSELEEHMKGEEQDDLPKFEAAISRDDSIAMAKQFSRTKQFAPTHSHPSAPDKGGLFETAAGLASAPIDKLKDMFSNFPDKV